VLFPHNFNADPDPLYAAPAPEPDPTPWYESATTGLQTLQGSISSLNCERPKSSIGPFWASFWICSVADPYPGSGAFLTPGSGIRNRFFLDPGLGSQTHIFDSLETIFWVKSSKILWKLAQIFFFSTSKLK
jgi:hypothetical protein